MATEGINPTAYTAEHHAVSFATRAYDDNLITYSTLTPAPPYPDYAIARFRLFGNGTTPVGNRNGVYVAAVGKWINQEYVSGTESLIIQIRKGTNPWISILIEDQYAMTDWPVSWRRFDVTSIVGSDPISEYEVRVLMYAYYLDEVPDKLPAFRLFELEFQVDSPAFTTTGNPMTVFGFNTGIKILNAVPAASTSANSTNHSGVFYGGVTAKLTGADGNVAVTVSAYTNPARTLYYPVELRYADVGAVTLTLACTPSTPRTASFANIPLVAPYGIRVETASAGATVGTVDVDIFVLEGDHGCSRG